MTTENKSDEFEMEYRVLGNTGLKVSVLGFGLMTLTSTEHAKTLISTVRKYGVNFFDNAEFYGNPCGKAEIYFGEALKQLQAEDAFLWKRSELVITTKLCFGIGNGEMENSYGRSFTPNDLGLSHKHLTEGMDASLKRLQLDYVDLVYAHRYDPTVSMEEIVRGFTALVRSGKALHWGTSTWTSQQITEAYWIAKVNNLIPPVVEQPQYNMFTREKIEDEYLPLFRAPYNLATTVWSPLDSGVLTGKYVKGVDDDSRLGGKNALGNKWWGAGYAQNKEKNEKVAKLMELCKTDLGGASMVNLALGWVIKHKNVTVCMLGGTKPHQLEQNMGSIACAQKLTPEIIEKIEGILANHPTRGRMEFSVKAPKQLITDLI